MKSGVLGIDIGGSGIKGGLVDINAGALVSDRYRVKTPSPATPRAVATAVSAIVSHFEYSGPVGVAFPGTIRNGIARLAANVDPSFLGVDVDALFSRAAGAVVRVINDADAAGVAEMRFGMGRGHDGTVLLLTFGSGIGSALFRDGILVPNTELGHLEFRGQDAEIDASARARKRDQLSYSKWCLKVNAYLAHVEMLFSPDLIIFGGGISKKWDKFGYLLLGTAPIRPARLENNAGIVGAALSAART